MKKTIKLSLAAAGVCGAAMFLLPNEAQAKKPGVLEGKPVVVDRLELRKFRFQITPAIGMSLSQPFVHKGLVGANLRFDFTDWIGLRASFMYGVINVDSKLLKSINNGGLPRGTAGAMDETYQGQDGPRRPLDQLDNPAPLLHDFQAGLTRLQYTGSLDVAFTPFSGKLGLFSAIFTEYDIYVFGGFGFAGWQRHYPDAVPTSDQLQIPNSTNPGGMDFCVEPNVGINSECLLHPVQPDNGFRPGGSFGAGIHLFLTDWAALNLEVHDIIVGHNDAGLNATIDDVPPQVQNTASGDRVVRHNASFNLGVTFYVPPKAKRSRLEQKLRKGKK
ncbi:MAG: outer membrane beta-barrel domain-containing protein [Deltaproteobacteria bacterium]|nr:outer membrane beta-barrel domain-containing protein [Deltaproteobacteria bacterium]